MHRVWPPWVWPSWTGPRSGSESETMSRISGWWRSASRPMNQWQFGPCVLFEAACQDRPQPLTEERVRSRPGERQVYKFKRSRTFTVATPYGGFVPDEVFAPLQSVLNEGQKSITSS